MDYNTQMTSNKQPYIMCPACFKGAILVDYGTKEGKCNYCSEEFTVNGMTVKYKPYQPPQESCG